MDFTMMTAVYSGLIGAMALLALASVAAYTVKEDEYAVIERFKSFARAAGPGLRLRIRGLDRVAGTISMKIRQLPVTLETRTRDNVWISLKVAVHYAVLPAKIRQAYYALQNPEEQIREQVRAAILHTVPETTLEEAFRQRIEIAKRIMNDLERVLGDFGYRIDSVLITDISLDQRVRDAMNEKATADYQLQAATAAGERERILRVAQAKADAEAKAYQGKGIADERRAIIEGLETSVAHFQQHVGGTTAQDIMTLVMLTQYFDTLTQLGRSGTNTILLPHSPGALTDISEQIRTAMIVGHRAGNPASHQPPAVPAPPAPPRAVQPSQHAQPANGAVAPPSSSETAAPPD